MTGVGRRSKSDPVSPILIFRHAERFRLGYERLRDVPTVQEKSDLAAPGIVLSAFASELYLKSLVAEETSSAPPPTHHLKKLFLMLRSSTRKRLEALWDEHTRSREASLRSAEAAFKVRLPRDLLSNLTDGNLGFQQMRYAYENDYFQFFIADLPLMLRRVAIELRPEWDQPLPVPQPVSTFPTR